MSTRIVVLIQKVSHRYQNFVKNSASINEIWKIKNRQFAGDTARVRRSSWALSSTYGSLLRSVISFTTATEIFSIQILVRFNCSGWTKSLDNVETCGRCWLQPLLVFLQNTYVTLYQATPFPRRNYAFVAPALAPCLEPMITKVIWVRATTEKMDDGSLQTAIVDETSSRLEKAKRESLEASLRQNQKMEVLYQLSGGMAHDFNNILQALVMNAELAKLNVTDLPVLTELIDQILQTAHRGAELTKRLLAFSRRSPLQLYPINANEVVRDSIRIVRRFHWRTYSHGKPTLIRPRCPFFGDPIQIEQALLNLCLNARDAMQGEGTLTVSTEFRELTAPLTAHNLTIKPGSYAVLSVKDTGPGIPTEVLPQIFEPCFTTKDVGKGTGLGLSVVYGIAKQYKGGVDAYKPSKGWRLF